MAKSKTVYTCQQCGAQAPKWQGQCPACGEWNTLVETITEQATKRQKTQGSARPVNTLAEIATAHERRFSTGMQEFDAVLGGGIVPGSVVLLGGDPGIGKSTLMLAALEHLPAGMPALYISAEESLGQIKMRAERMQVANSSLSLLNETDIDAIVATIRELHPLVVVLDSIQAVTTGDLSGQTGSVGQVRECAARLTQLAKEQDIAVFIIGHVTKEGVVAGPRTLEHMVDTVLYLEGDPVYHYRLLRAVKNRFGSLSEVGIFEMTAGGLQQVANPSGLFISGDTEHASGSVLTVTMEGSRAIMLELQALTVKTGFGYPKRTTSGYPLQRLQLLLAVLTRRAGLALYEQDVYANIIGGYKLEDTAVDLALCLAIASSVRDVPLAQGTVVVGEVSLSGGIRPVRQLDARVKEAVNLGARKILVPQLGYDTIKRYAGEVDCVPVQNIRDALGLL
ncbi:MAG TPA: DNA repair protein RadA [bacterium]|nr:DNA repair protein RadA [bacterium]